jgi:alkylhydroperoxidase family enzyme
MSLTSFRRQASQGRLDRRCRRASQRRLNLDHLSWAVVNTSQFCVGAHTATAAQAFGDEEPVRAVLAELDAAPIQTGLRTTLRLLESLSTTGALDPDEVRAVFSAGVTPQQVADALAVNFGFNVTGRLSNAFAFEMLSREGFETGARYLLKRGYK